MQVSHTMILNKIEEKIKEAKAVSSETKIREQLQVIKTLCELVLEESPSVSESQNYQILEKNYEPVRSVPTVQTVSTLSEKKMKTEDGSNGDSIFDF